MNKTRNILMAEMLFSIAVSLIIVVLFETDTLLPGTFAADTNTEFLSVTMMEIITICAIPFALRLFKFKGVNRSLSADKERGLLVWGSVRMMGLCLPMMVNTLLYYLFSFNVAFGYMAIICLICLVFIYPSMRRCLAETIDNEANGNNSKL
ncbi:MAG: hypothetical protein Q4D41_09545 [Prevotellaceae bacterium]|nr:hypothetical protein [Prevotellaceae bacterium]